MSSLPKIAGGDGIGGSYGKTSPMGFTKKELVEKFTYKLKQARNQLAQAEAAGNSNLAGSLRTQISEMERKLTAAEQAQDAMPPQKKPYKLVDLGGGIWHIRTASGGDLGMTVWKEGTGYVGCVSGQPQTKGSSPIAAAQALGRKWGFEVN